MHLVVLNTGSFGHSLTGKNWASTWCAPLRTAPSTWIRTTSAPTPASSRARNQGEHELSWQVMVGGRFDETRVSRAAQVFSTLPVWQVYYPQPERVEG